MTGKVRYLDTPVDNVDSCSGWWRRVLRLESFHHHSSIPATTTTEPPHHHTATFTACACCCCCCCHKPSPSDHHHHHPHRHRSDHHRIPPTHALPFSASTEPPICSPAPTTTATCLPAAGLTHLDPDILHAPTAPATTTPILILYPIRLSAPVLDQSAPSIRATDLDPRRIAHSTLLASRHRTCMTARHEFNS